MAGPPDMIAMIAEKVGEKLFAVNADGSRPLAWKDLVSKRNRLAWSLNKRLPAEAVAGAVYARNCPEWLLSQIGCGALGLRFSPINWHLVADEISYIVQDCDADVVFFGAEFASTVAAIKAQTPAVKLWVCIDGVVDGAVSLTDLINDAPADATLPTKHGRQGGMVGYTGGSTGKPKGAFRSAKPQDPKAGMAMIQEWGFHVMFPNQVQLVAAPLYHAMPTAMAAIGMNLGTTFVCMPKFEPALALAAIEKFQVGGFFMPPILLKRLLQVPKEERAKYDTSSVKNIMVSGAACPSSVKQGIFDMLGPVMRELYGASELGGVAIMGPEDMMRKPLSCGKPAAGMDVIILDDHKQKVTAPNVPGEIFAKGFVIDGYHKKEQATKDSMYGDYFSVGDVGYMDEEGFLYISDRKTDMIVSGGVNIYPIETEEVLHKYDIIEDCAVFGVPDSQYGERVHACVKLMPGAKATASSILQWCDGKIAKFKLPREADISFHAEDFVRSDAGKLRKKQLRQTIIDRPASKL